MMCMEARYYWMSDGVRGHDVLEVGEGAVHTNSLAVVQFLRPFVAGFYG